jgi:hypothetical protein
VVEQACLESMYTRKGIEGSNPSPSVFFIVNVRDSKPTRPSPRRGKKGGRPALEERSFSVVGEKESLPFSEFFEKRIHGRERANCFQ